jgi:hypothetical protein
VSKKKKKGGDEETTPTPPLIPAGTRSFTTAGDEGKGTMFVRDPRTGAVVEMPDEDAKTRVLADGWTVVDEKTGEDVRTDALLRERSDALEAGLHGVGKGLTGGLIDFATDDPDALRAVKGMEEGSPIASIGGEVVGTLAPFAPALKGAKLATIPGLADEAGQLLTTAVAGESPGFLAQAGARALGVGVEGGAQGALYELRRSHVDDTPLTAEKLAFGFMAGALPGAVIGGGIGTLEAAGNSLGRRFALRGGLARDEVLRPGVTDADARLISERDFGGSSPGMLEEFQAARIGEPSITPDTLALAKDSGPVGQQFRREIGPEGAILREQAEQATAKAFDDLADQEAALFTEWSGKIKKEHIERLVGDDLVSAADVDDAVARAADVGNPLRGEAAGGLSSAVESTLKVDDAATAELKNALGADDASLLKLVVKSGIEAQDPHVIAAVNRYLKRVPAALKKMPRNDTRAPVPAEPEPFARVDAMKFEGMRDGSLAQAKEELARDPSAAERWASGKHPPTITIDDAVTEITHRHVTDGRHRILAAQQAGVSSIPVKIRRLDAEGNATESVERLALGDAKPQLRPYAQGLAANDNAAPFERPGLVRGNDVPPADEQDWAWRRDTLRKLDQYAEDLEYFETHHRGYTGGKNKQLRDMRGLLAEVRDRVANGKRWQAARELDFLKKKLAKPSKPGTHLGVEDTFAGTTRKWYDDLRLHLEDARYWGDGFASMQQQFNSLIHKRLSRSDRFWDVFFSDAGRPDPRNPWTNLKRADVAKIKSAVGKFNAPEHDLEFQMVKEHVKEARQLNELMGQYFKTDRIGQGQLAAWNKAVDSADEAITRAKYFAMRQEQGKALAGGSVLSGPVGSARALAGYMLGGPAGAIAGMALNSAMNPGAMIHARAVLERTLRASEGRIARGVTKLLTGKGGKAKLPSIGATALGSKAVVSLFSETDPEKRARAYNATLSELADAVVPGRAEAAMAGLAPVGQFVPGAQKLAAERYRMAAAAVLQAAPVRPYLGPFGDEELAYPSDEEIQAFEDSYRGALDPLGVLEAAVDGELSAEMVDAADQAAPELMNHIRGVIMQVVAEEGSKVGYDAKVQLSVLFKMPLDPTMAPEYINAVQTMHRARFQEGMGPRSRRTFDETGLNDGYEKDTMSHADRLEREETIR